MESPERGAEAVRAMMMTNTKSEAARKEPGLLESQDTDVLTTLLEPCRFRSVFSRPWHCASPWGMEALQSPPGFVIVLAGSCVLDLGDEAGTQMLQAHDMAMVSRECHVRLRDRPTTPVVPVTSVFQPEARLVLRDGAERSADGTTAQLLTGTFARADDYTRQMFDLLPPLLVLRGNVGVSGAGIRPLVDLLLMEFERTKPGSELISNRVLQILLIHALRQTNVLLPDAAGGLLAALRVPGLGATMSAIHSRPDHDWSVHELAELAGLSRAAFAARFLETVGLPPFHYLRDVRMRLACRLLCESEKGIKEIATRVGYATEASFSKAFTRWCGHAPGEYRRSNRGHETPASRDGADE